MIGPLACPVQRCTVSCVHMPNATVHLDTQNTTGRIDPRLFGGFLEHLGRAVYQGVYDPGNPLSDANGFRRDVLEALRPLGMPIVRYPGGNFVSAYDWRDGIGPKDQRPRRPDFAWRSIETNQFGTDEFMTWCDFVGTKPMMAVNLGTRGPGEAAELVEYCNMAGGTSWSDRRKANGHADPYGVKLWCLGNEMDGPWQAGHMPAEVYAMRAFAASMLMKGIDPTIETIACGSSNRYIPTYLKWDRVVLEHCWDQIDYISAHRYSENWRNDSAWFLAEGIDIDRTLHDYAGLIAYVRGVLKSPKAIHLSFDEWNVWYRQRGGANEVGNWREAPPLLEEIYNLEDALVCAQYLAAFVRRADLVKIACIAQIVNVIAPILTRDDGLLLQSIYWPLQWFSKFSAGRLSLTPIIQSPMYPAGDRGDVPSLDVAAAYDEIESSIAVYLTNRDVRSPVAVTVDVADRKLTGVLSAVALAGSDLKAHNTFDRPNTIGPTTLAAEAVDGKLRVTVPGVGFACVRVKVTSV